ncbi:MAG TPA: branched-chain amino acid ABC transporter ATP-binding protein/permease, partial [Candidatus Limnocylindria bacterium]|nr:branched-chain amino acid ABC transporter ATP-binding protein/permease [Candidatus Limnocylindria bacterium]
LAAVLSMLLALAVGALAFRLRSLRGEIFALLTLAVPFILAALARFNSAIDGGQGIIVTLPSFPDFIGGFQDLVYLVSLLIGWASVAIAFAMQRSRPGWALFSIRDAEDVAEGLGVPTFRYKMVAIAITGMLAGAAGSVFALQVGFVTVENAFGLTVPLYVIVMSVLGGRFHWLGPAIGAVVIVTLRDWLSAQGFEGWNLVILGTVLAVLILVAAEGLMARLGIRPRLTVGAFVGVLLVMAGLTATNIGPFGELETIDWVAAGMIAASVVAFWPARWTRLRLVEPGEPEPAAEASVHPGEAQEAVAVAGAPIIEVVEVARHFGGIRALRGVSLTVSEGELVGLVGPNGSGKTTLISLISGALAPTSGSIRIGGRETAGMEPHDIAHLGVARTYQIPRPFATMTVRDNVAMALMFGREPLALGAARAAAEEHLELVGLTHRALALPAEINLHERQLLEMARAIATRPRVLLLDEALAGLNPAEIDNAAQVVRRIHASGIAIVLVEHLLRVVNQLATRIVVLDQGLTLAEGAPESVMRNPEVVRAYLGRQAHA